jgi:predicted small lipoprotein YifL
MTRGGERALLALVFALAACGRDGFRDTHWPPQCRALDVARVQQYSTQADLLEAAGDYWTVRTWRLPNHVDGKQLTQTPLSVPSGENCPTAGVINVTLSQGQAQITFNLDMSVVIQGDGIETLMAPNCLDPRLLMCAA